MGARRELREAERERTNILVSFIGAVVAFVYYEMGRRQSLTEAREEARRTYVDTELRHLSDLALEASSRAEGAETAERVRRERYDAGWKPKEHLVLIVGSVVGIVGLVVIVIAYNVFG